MVWVWVWCCAQQQAEEDLTKFGEPAVDAMQQEKAQLLQRYRAEAADSGKR